MIIGLIFLIALALVLVIFTLQNTDPVTIQVLFWQIEQSPLALTIFVCVIAGIVIGAGISIPKLWRSKKQAKNLRKEVETLKAELKSKAVINTPAKEEATKKVSNPEGELMIENDNDLFKE